MPSFLYHFIIGSGSEMRRMVSTLPDDTACTTFPSHVNNTFAGLTQSDTLL